MRYRSVILLWGAAVSWAATEPGSADVASQWAADGQFHFYACEFKQAARALEKAVIEQPDNAALYYWLGKSYARLAEVSGPFSAAKNAGKARRSLERAVQIDLQNDAYLQELFDFYMDSPEWFNGGLDRAAMLLGRFSPGNAGAESRAEQIAGSRKEHSGAAWWARLAVLRASRAIGCLVP